MELTITMFTVFLAIFIIGIVLLCLYLYLRLSTEEVVIIEDKKKIKELTDEYEDVIKHCYTTTIEKDYLKVVYDVHFKRNLWKLTQLEESSRKISVIVHYIKL